MDTVPSLPRPQPVFADGKGVLQEICLSHSEKRVTEKAFFHYEPDSNRYDNILHIRATYSRNHHPDLAYCLENTLLSSTYSTTKRLNRIKKEILPFVLTLRQFYFPATLIRLETLPQTGDVVFSIHPDDEVIPDSVLPNYPQVPKTLHQIPTVSLCQLKRVRNIAYDVDLVSWPGNPGFQFAFKKITHEARMLAELETLNALQSCSGINPLLAIVVSPSRYPVSALAPGEPQEQEQEQDQDGISKATDSNSIGTEKGDEAVVVPEGHIRGFLAQYLPFGDLGEFLERRMHARLDFDSIDKGGDTISTERAVFDEEFPWKTKLMWATTLARTLVYMHSRGIVSGDLKPDNVLLHPEGDLKLMDFGPVGPTEGWGAPEYSKEWVAHRARLRLATLQGARIDDTETTRDFDFKKVLKPSTDIYGLGGLLWAIGEECYGDVQKRKWVRSPQWYRDLVEMCLSEDPKMRPTAAGILLRLFARRTMFFLTG